jgi:hypothetical protein
MRNTQGGTQKYCPECERITVCRAVSPSTLGYQSGQRFYKTDHTDIQWFRRGLVCNDCGHEWLTAEVQEEFLNELTELRDALQEVKENAENYVAESGKAMKSLEKLSKSLSILRALNIYKRQ